MKKIIGMIHLAGDTKNDKIERALEEIRIYEEHGLYGAIIENYHGSVDQTILCASEASKKDHKIRLGVNILPNEYHIAYEIAELYGLEFIQLDHVSGSYIQGTLNNQYYNYCRTIHPDVKVYAGVWPKYYTPILESSLENDLKIGMERCDSIVVTGRGTGMQTPIEKIKEFRKAIGDKELIIGAGLDKYNAREQLAIADGAIIGSYFKNGDTRGKLDEERIKEIMDIAKEYK